MKKVPKYLNIMRISAFLLFLCIFTSFATKSSSQNSVVNINGSNLTIGAFIDQVETQTDYLFVYSKSEVNMTENLAVSSGKKSVAECLQEAFNDSDVKYVFENDYIVLTKNASPSVPQQTRRVTGKIIDNYGETVLGANVVEKGTTNGTVTDINGDFSLSVSEGATLTITYIGYLPQEIVVGNRTTINITLQEDTQRLDEVVVVGYGTQKRINLTGAVDQVTSETLENRPTTNISQMLAGAVPNLNIQLLDGKPTQSPEYNIRGTTSIGQGGSALILIDGVEGDPAMLNPNDVESISVLKDAASASIYGARGAFGVVLITTKSPTKGRTSISYSGNVSLKFRTATPDNVTESYPWAKSFSDAWSAWNDYERTPTAINKTLVFSPEYLAEIKRRWEDPSLPRVEINPNTGMYEYYYSTDWYREVFKSNTFAQDHNITLSGGNEIASFYITGRVNTQDGMYRYNTDKYNMYNFRSKGVINLTSWLQVDNNTEYSFRKYHQPENVGEGSGIWRNMADEGHPLAPLLNPDGTLSFPAAYTVGDHYYGKNATDREMRVIKSKTAFKAEFFDKSLTVRGDFTFQDTDDRRVRTRVPVPYSRYQGVTGYTGSNTNDIRIQKYETSYYATNFYAEYAKKVADAHMFNLLAGYNYEQYERNETTMSRNGLVYEDAQDINLAVGESITTSGGYRKWKIAGGFFRLNYNFKERYLLEVNGRYDGSSKFPSDEQWAFFPSASVGWRMSEESFWKVSENVLSDVKIRGSYGSLGNGNIDPYKFMETFSIAKSDLILNGIRPQKTSQPAVIPSGLTWETTTTANFGLDFSSLNGRIRFTGDFYRRWTKDMFTVGPSLPEIFGADVPKGNYADMETTGWEISVTWRDQFRLADKPFHYDIRLTMDDSYADITKYNNPEKLLTDHYEGKRYGELWGYRVEGLFQSEEDVANSASQINIPASSKKINLPGDVKFKDLDGDGVIYQGLNRVGDSGDKEIIGNSEPRYRYGISLSADWNGFFFSAFFRGVLKQDWWPGGESPFWGQYNRPYNQLPRWHVDNMWTEENQNFDAYLPRLRGYNAQGTGRSLNVMSDRYLQNVAYIRLQNLQFGYTLPKKISSKISANDIKVYFSGENLWTWSPLYKRTKDLDVLNIYGSDRDLSGGTSGNGFNYPSLRAVSLGLTVNF